MNTHRIFWRRCLSYKGVGGRKSHLLRRVFFWPCHPKPLPFGAGYETIKMSSFAKATDDHPSLAILSAGTLMDGRAIRNPAFWGGVKDGATETIRTSDLFLRREALYPAELRPQTIWLFQRILSGGKYSGLTGKSKSCRVAGISRAIALSILIITDRV